MPKIRVPATSANLGPGFDCLGLALDVWNEVHFEAGPETVYIVSGEGADKLNRGARNLLTRAYEVLHEACGRTIIPARITAWNGIMMSSGMGSSAAAIVAGLMGANEMLGRPLDSCGLLKLATEMEGHPDNVAPALYGGLVVSAMNGAEIISRRMEVPQWTIVVVRPEVEWLTKTARSVLPKSVSRVDAIFNLGRASLVVEALRAGDLSLLQQVMEDRLHQPYRLKHIPGGPAAYKTAKRFGAAALSGAGPSIINFVAPEKAEEAKAAVMKTFAEMGIEARGLVTRPSLEGAHLTE